MAYNIKLADKVRAFLSNHTTRKLEEKKMFRGLTFMVDGKMCVSVSGENLMCRFDPALQHEVENRKGYQPMMMKQRQLKGYCYVSEQGFKAKNDFEYWVKLCLAFNDKAKSSKK